MSSRVCGSSCGGALQCWREHSLSRWVDSMTGSPNMSPAYIPFFKWLDNMTGSPNMCVALPALRLQVFTFCYSPLRRRRGYRSGTMKANLPRPQEIFIFQVARQHDGSPNICLAYPRLGLWALASFHTKTEKPYTHGVDVYDICYDIGV
jgi:hypothetical protein